MGEPFPASRANPLLLLTDYHPTSQGGGAVILKSLLDQRAWESIVCVTPALKTGFPVEPGMRVVELVKGSAGRSGMRRRSIEADMLLHASALAAEIDEIARAHNAAGLWVVLHGAAVQIADRFMRISGLPVHVSVHDDPPFATSLRSRKQFLLTLWVARVFRRVVTRAASVDVISDAMRERYQSRYNRDSVVIHRGLPEPILPSSSTSLPQELSIGVLGNTYSYTPLRQLAGALAAAAVSLHTRGGIVVIGQSHGQRLTADCGDQINIEVTGHLSELEGIERLKRCTALYLNYPFAARDRVLRQTSFPTKLSTYIRAARPLLIHAPADSSTATLREIPDYAVLWQTCSIADGARAIESLYRFTTSSDVLAERAEMVRQRYFDYSQNRSRLYGVLRHCLIQPRTTGEQK